VAQAFLGQKFSSQKVGGLNKLAEGEAAIAGWDLSVSQKAEAVAFHFLLDRLR
jgi:hypothetical protein